MQKIAEIHYQIKKGGKMVADELQWRKVLSNLLWIISKSEYFPNSEKNNSRENETLDLELEIPQKIK